MGQVAVAAVASLHPCSMPLTVSLVGRCQPQVSNNDTLPSMSHKDMAANGGSLFTDLGQFGPTERIFSEEPSSAIDA